jgi:hypothetical protein
MRRSFLISIAVAAVLIFSSLGTASAVEIINCKGAWSSLFGKCRTTGSAGYANAAWGSPVALVVPPTAELQTNWGWGVGNTRVTPIATRFKRDYPGPVVSGPATYKATPAWPSDTVQFGDYYIRGPW